MLLPTICAIRKADSGHVGATGSDKECEHRSEVPLYDRQQWQNSTAGQPAVVFTKGTPCDLRS